MPASPHAHFSILDYADNATPSVVTAPTVAQIAEPNSPNAPIVITFSELMSRGTITPQTINTGIPYNCPIDNSARRPYHPWKSLKVFIEVSL
ncbi:MAG: hypothetical protein JW936_05470 [Sedimentisphaerales bacterium]|nr:hypothetical protein [Sedimentisphaerales bacterium]